MISFFRRIFTSRFGGIFALGFLGLIAVAFAAGDISNLGFGGNSGISGGNVAQAGKQSIGIGELRQAIQNAHSQAQERQPGLSMAQFIAEGGAERVLDNLIEGLVLEQYAKKLGFAASNAEVEGRIASMPQFQGVTGQFDQGRFEQWLQATRLSEARLRTLVAREILVEQLLAPVGRVAKVPQGMAAPYADLLLEAREGTAVFIPSSAYAPATEPSDAQLQAYLKANPRPYRIGEQRSIRYAEFNVADLAKAAEVTDAEVAEFFKANAARYAGREQRRFSQVVAPDQAAGEKLAAAARNGGLDAAAKSAGLSAATVEAASESDLATRTTAEAAKAGFAAARGQVIGPFKGDLGFFVLRVEDVTGTAARTLPQVSAEIRKELAERKRAEAAIDAYNKIADAVNGGASVTEVAKNHDLTVVTTPLLTAAATSREQPGFVVGETLAKIIPSAFALPGDNISEIQVLEQNKRFAVAEVAKIVPESLLPMAEIRPRLIADWKQSEGAKIARDLANKVAEAASKTGDLAAATRSVGARNAGVQTIRGVRRDVQLASQQGRGVPELALLFTMDARTTKTRGMPGNVGSMVIFLDRITPGDSSTNPNLRSAVQQELPNVLGNELTSQLLAEAKRQIKTEIDQAVLKTLKTDLGGASANP